VGNSNEPEQTVCQLCFEDLHDALPGIDYFRGAMLDGSAVRFCLTCVGPDSSPRRLQELCWQLVEIALGDPRARSGHA